MLNVVAIIGRLGANPQLRQTPTGTSVCSFSIACDKNKSGTDGKHETDWIPVVAFGKTAEFICKYFTKGMSIAIDGRLQSRNYKSKTGENRTAVEIYAMSVDFVSPKSKDTGYQPEFSAPIDEEEDMPY